jgi:hypothetical protein
MARGGVKQRFLPSAKGYELRAASFEQPVPVEGLSVARGSQPSVTHAQAVLMRVTEQVWGSTEGESGRNASNLFTTKTRSHGEKEPFFFGSLCLCVRAQVGETRQAASLPCCADALRGQDFCTTWASCCEQVTISGRSQVGAQMRGANLHPIKPKPGSLGTPAWATRGEWMCLSG